VLNLVVLNLIARQVHKNQILLPGPEAVIPNTTSSSEAYLLTRIYGRFEMQRQAASRLHSSIWAASMNGKRRMKDAVARVQSKCFPVARQGGECLRGDGEISYPVPGLRGVYMGQ
jgi:hypothetical protein